MVYKRSSKASRARFQSFLNKRRDESKARFSRRKDVEKLNKEFQQKCEMAMSAEIERLEEEGGRAAKNYLLSNLKVTELEDKLKVLGEEWKRKCDFEVSLANSNMREKIEEGKQKVLEDRAEIIKELKGMRAQNEVSDREVARLKRELENAKRAIEAKDARIGDLLGRFHWAD